MSTANVLTIGEPMALMVANEVKPLEEVENFARHVCGAELNFAVGMTRLGHKTGYISRIGNDPFGKHIKTFLQLNGIDTANVTLDPDNLTGMQLKAKVTYGDPEVINYRRHTAFTKIIPADLAAINWVTLKHLHVTGIPLALSLSARQTVEALVEQARSHSVRISFDCNLRPALWPDKQEMIDVINRFAAKADIFMPGIGEARTLSGLEKKEDIADFYLQRGASTIIIKMGVEGAYVKTCDDAYLKSHDDAVVKTREAEFSVPAVTIKKVVDTVGAGDGFAVGVISALLEGQSLRDAVKRGAMIGARAVTFPGDNEGLPTPEELQEFINAHQG